VCVLRRLCDTSDAVPKVDNTKKLEKIGEAITIIKSIEDAKREKKNKSDANAKKGGGVKSKDGKK